MGGRTVREFQDSMRALYGVGQQAAQRQRQRERLAVQQDGICPACELPLPEDLTETDVDHIIPKSRGGPDLPWNKRLLHLKCNRRKHSKLTAEAEELAAKHGVILHVPLGDTHIADRPLTWSDSLLWDYLNELSQVPAEDIAKREALTREYLDTRRYLDESRRRT